MCKTCGCSDESQVTLTDLRSGRQVGLSQHTHHHDNNHGHDHHDHHHHHGPHTHEHVTTVDLATRILAKNDRLAARNRGWLAGRGVTAINLLGAPGAGKTTLLERTIRTLRDRMPIYVIEGDQSTLNDAQRIDAAGCPAVQINTGAGCHLDADMVASGLEQLNPPQGALVVIENVGNLVCPALFDLGEHAKVVIASVTEGDDKPAKYPHMFRAADLVLLNKVDLLPYVSFSVQRFIEAARLVNPALEMIQVSATSGEGLEAWHAWLGAQSARRPQRSHAMIG